MGNVYSYGSEHVYFVPGHRENRYVTTVKHWYVSPPVKPGTVIARLKSVLGGVGCTAPVPVAVGTHTVAD